MELAAATEDANQARQELRVVRAELARSRAQQATVSPQQDDSAQCCLQPCYRQSAGDALKSSGSACSKTLDALQVVSITGQLAEDTE